MELPDRIERTRELAHPPRTVRRTSELADQLEAA